MGIKCLKLTKKLDQFAKYIQKLTRITLEQRQFQTTFSKLTINSAERRSSIFIGQVEKRLD